MSIRLEMLQVARSAPSLLPDAGLVRRFLASQIHQDGGFKGRRDTSDLYYTVFGLEGLLALGAEAVLVGRPFCIYAVGGGEEGIAYLHRQYSEELENAMTLCGKKSLQEIGPNDLKRIE